MTEPDIERRLVEVLRNLDQDRVPDELRRRVLAIPAVEPVGGAIAVRARSGRATTALLAAAALLVTVIWGGAILAGGSDDTGPSPNATALVTAGPATTAIPATRASVEPSSLVSWPAGEPVAGALEPGSYALPKPYGTSDYKRVILTLPDGWAFSEGLLHRAVGGVDRLAIDAGPVHSVYPDPCRWAGATPEPFRHEHPSIGPTEIRTQALLGQLAEGVPPVEVDLRGAFGLLLRMSVPQGLDIASCDGGEFRRWTTKSSAPETAHFRSVAGQTDVVYFVDVDRQALLVRGSAGPSASAGEIAELEKILGAMIIER